MRGYWKSCVAVTLLAIVAGCGGGGDAPKLGRVTGTVTIDGQPAPDVNVTFTPAEGGRPSTGKTDASGKYSLVYSASAMGAAIGKHEVSISGSGGFSDEDLDDPNIDLTNPPSSVPAEYSEIKKEVEVTSGSNTIDLEYP